MHNPAPLILPSKSAMHGAARRDPLLVQWGLTLLAVAVIGILIVVPLVNVFWQAFAGGLAAYWGHLVNDRDTLHSLDLTITEARVGSGASARANFASFRSRSWTISPIALTPRSGSPTRRTSVSSVQRSPSWV